MDKLNLLKQASFGARVAEEETAELASYFVETDQWTRIVRGEIDVIRGEKGAGKSAIYSLLMNKFERLPGRRLEHQCLDPLALRLVADVLQLLVEAGIMPDDDREPMQTRDELPQQLQPLGDHLGRGQR
jgi:hypothetical protein